MFQKVEEFLVDLQLLEVDSLICLRMCMKFEENTMNPYGPINSTLGECDVDSQNSEVSERERN